MNILLDFTQIPLERTGVGVYADHLLLELSTLLDSADHLFVLAQDDDTALAEQLRRSAKISLLTISARWFRNRAALLLFEQAFLPWLLLRNRIDLLHSLHYTHPLVAPCARAVTIHDLTFSLFPELHTRGRRVLFPFFTRQALRRAECPIFVSRSTQQDAERLFGRSGHPGHITHLGVSSPPAMKFDRALPLAAALGVSPPFVLFIGTLEPRKNIIRIVRAFEQIAPRQPQLTLVLGGKLGWHAEEIASAIDNSQFRERIRRLGFVTEEQKQALLCTCEMLVYPSLYEGFGLPVLEAMAHGVPVVTSGLSAMPEVAGNAALLIDPNSADAIAAAMEQVIVDFALAAELRASGLTQAAKFEWAKTAEATFAAYRAVVERRKSR